MNFSPLMLSIRGPHLGVPERIDRNAAKSIGGYILFSQNFTSKTQLQSLTTEIKNSRERFGLPPPLIAVDHEGGKVQRFCGDGFTKIPHPQTIGDLYLHDKTEAIQLIQDIGLVISAELGSCGINLCLGPTLDLNVNHATRVTYRSYSDDKDIVSTLSGEMLKTLKIHGMNATAKHYPGFGAAIEDTHTHAPLIKIPLKEIINSHLIPFEFNIRENTIPCLMLTHGIYQKVDGNPVPTSKFWLQDYLRKKLRYNGVIITDCLAMIAASSIGSNYIDKINNCLKAGCDIVLITHTQNSLYKVIKKLQTNDQYLHYSHSLQAKQSAERIIKLINNPKSEDYYNNLLESLAYKESKRNIARWSEAKPRKTFNCQAIKAQENIFTSKLRKMKFLKKPIFWNKILFIHRICTQLKRKFDRYRYT